MLGLPDGVTACLFDLDGVLTDTAKVHSRAWKQMFDDDLGRRAAKMGDELAPFDAGIADFFETRIDGVVAERDHLAGKPAPDTYLAGAKALGVGPDQAAVFEDALSGVAAGRPGNFGCVVGVDRVDHADGLRANGATVVVKDLAELLQGPSGPLSGGQGPSGPLSGGQGPSA